MSVSGYACLKQSTDSLLFPFFQNNLILIHVLFGALTITLSACLKEASQSRMIVTAVIDSVFILWHVNSEISFSARSCVSLFHSSLLHHTNASSDFVSNSV